MQFNDPISQYLQKSNNASTSAQKANIQKYFLSSIYPNNVDNFDLLAISAKVTDWVRFSYQDIVPKIKLRKEVLQSSSAFAEIRSNFEELTSFSFLDFYSKTESNNFTSSTNILFRDLSADGKFTDKRLTQLFERIHERSTNTETDLRRSVFNLKESLSTIQSSNSCYKKFPDSFFPQERRMKYSELYFKVKNSSVTSYFVYPDFTLNIRRVDKMSISNNDLANTLIKSEMFEKSGTVEMLDGFLELSKQNRLAFVEKKNVVYNTPLIGFYLVISDDELSSMKDKDRIRLSENFIKRNKSKIVCKATEFLFAKGKFLPNKQNSFVAVILDCNRHAGFFEFFYEKPLEWRQIKERISKLNSSNCTFDFNKADVRSLSLINHFKKSEKPKKIFEDELSEIFSTPHHTPFKNASYEDVELEEEIVRTVKHAETNDSLRRCHSNIKIKLNHNQLKTIEVESERNVTARRMIPKSPRDKSLTLSNNLFSSKGNSNSNENASTVNNAIITDQADLIHNLVNQIKDLKVKINAIEATQRLALTKDVGVNTNSFEMEFTSNLMKSKSSHSKSITSNRNYSNCQEEKSKEGFFGELTVETKESFLVTNTKKVEVPSLQFTNMIDSLAEEHFEKMNSINYTKADISSFDHGQVVS